MTARREAPAFAAAFPRDPELDPLVAAFARGDFARVRRDARRLIASTVSPGVRAAAVELLARTGPDPLSSVFFALTAALLVFLSVYWWWRAGGRS